MRLRRHWFASFMLSSACLGCGHGSGSQSDPRGDASASSGEEGARTSPKTELLVHGGRANAVAHVAAAKVRFGTTQADEFSWRLTELRRGGASQAIDEGRERAEGPRAFVEHGLVSELYEPHRDGVEHSLILATKPRVGASDSAGSLELSLRLFDARADVAIDGASVVLRATSDGAPRARVHALSAKDARGRPLATRFASHRPDALDLVIDDGGAIYPVTIDPTITPPLLTTVTTAAPLSVGYDGAAVITASNSGVSFYALIGGKWTAQSGFGGGGNLYSNNALFHEGFGVVGLMSLNAVSRYERGSSPWKGLGYLTAPSGISSGANYGAAITSAGVFLIAGGPGDTSACTGCSGSIANWKFPAATVSARRGPSAPETAQGFGCMVAAQADGAGNTIVAVGSCYDRGTTYVGRADIATFDATGAWAPGTTTLTQPPLGHHAFGNTLALDLARNRLYVASDERVYAYTASGTTLPTFSYAGVAFEPPAGLKVARGGVAVDRAGTLAVGTAPIPTEKGALYLLDTTTPLPHVVRHRITSSTTGTVMGISPYFGATGIAFIESTKGTYVYDPVAGVPVGGACLSNNDCSNDTCTAGFCCPSSCTLGCDASGTCTSPAPVGGACTTNPTCITGTCAGGFCCSGPCSGGTCDATGACSIPAPAGASCTGDARCASGVCGAGQCCAATCGTGVCDATGACIAPKIPGASCTTNTACASGVCAGGFCCGGACAGTCDATGACTTPAGTDPLGATCTTGASCASGRCVDGVCCDGACSGVCEACNQSGKLGTCAPIVGAPSSGHGACPTSTCSGAVAVSYACDGKSGGSCSVRVNDCAPYRCDAAACKTSCATDSDCGAGYVCNGGACAAPSPPKSPSGAPAIGVPVRACERDDECATGHCADGVCCDTACTGKCKTCSFGNQAGHCIDQPDGFDKRGDCASDLCQSVCDGAGECRPARAGDQCQPSRCADATKLVGPAVCAAQGAKCGTEAVATYDCAPYACAIDACLLSCSSSRDCAPGSVCDPPTGKCVPPPLAAADDSGCSVGAPRGLREGGSFALVAIAAAVMRRRRTSRP